MNQKVINKKRYIDYFIQNDIKSIDYKNIEVLKKFLSAEGKIFPARRSGLISKHQRKLSKSIKRARMIGLLPFTYSD